MDMPPSVDMLSENCNSSFISFKDMPEYIPSYHWNDDERDTKDYLQYYDDRVQSRQIWCEHVPVFKIMKELYDEEKNALYRSDSMSSQTDSEIYDVNSYLWSNDREEYCYSDEASVSEDDTVTLPQNEDVIEVSTQNKFMYT